MRSLAFVIATFITSPAYASPDDDAWATVAIGFGASPVLTGFADRLQPCDASSCSLSSRIALSGGLGRWAFELQVANSPVIDDGALDDRDRERAALRVGPAVRYTLLRGYGFDLSVRGGVHAGALLGEDSTTWSADPDCPISREGMCPQVATTYEPDNYSFAALSMGATLRLGVRVPEDGFFGLFADLDYTLARIGLPDDPQIGALRAMSYGFMFGSMFDD